MDKLRFIDKWSLPNPMGRVTGSSALFFTHIEIHCLIMYVHYGPYAKLEHSTCLDSHITRGRGRSAPLIISVC